MPMTCSAHLCKNRFSSESSVSFFSFPRDKEIRDKWLKALGIKDLKVTRHSKICSEHFLPEDFKPHTRIRILLDHAVPSVFSALPSLNQLNESKKRTAINKPQMSESEEKPESYCRLCANLGRETVPIFASNDSSVPYSEIISKYLSIQVSQEDQLPLELCISCAYTLSAFNKLADEAVKAENKLKQILAELQESPKAVDEIAEESSFPEDVDFFDDSEVLPEKKKPSGKKETGRKTKLTRLSEAEKACQAIPSAWHDILCCAQCDAIGSKPFAAIGSSVIINCAQCGEKVTGTGNYITHLKQHKNRKEEKSNQEYACHKCGRNFAFQSSVLDHEKICGLADSFACESCGKRFPTSAAVEAHARSHNASCVCHLCGKQFHRPSSLNQHIRLKHENLTFICHVCGKSCRSKGHLREHIQHHTGEMDFTCQICGKGSTNAYSFSVHLATHTDEKPFKCSFCPKTFKHTKYVYIHERAVHCETQKTQKKPSKNLADRMCDECGLVFHRASTLAIHRRTVHEGKKAYVCKICGKDFNYASLLCVHRRTRHFPELCKHKCPECEKVFATRGDLRRHLGKHTGDKRFECPPCGKRYAFSGSLSMHIRTHHQRESLKKLPCEQCGAVFNFPSHLQRHMASHNTE